MFQKVFLGFFLFSIANSYSYASNECPQVQTVNDLNLTEYIRAPWYIQMQQVTPYLPKNSNYCVFARYNTTNRHVPFFSGTVLLVYNYANRGRVNGNNLNFNNTTLCARVPNSNESSKLLVAPCFLPNLFGGDYWVIDVGPETNNYEYAIVIGGQPNVRLSDGCTTSNSTMNNSGLWIFSRNNIVNSSFIEERLAKLKSMNISTSLLNNVTQENCTYREYYEISNI